MFVIILSIFFSVMCFGAEQFTAMKFFGDGSKRFTITFRDSNEPISYDIPKGGIWNFDENTDWKSDVSISKKNMDAVTDFISLISKSKWIQSTQNFIKVPDKDVISDFWKTRIIDLKKGHRYEWRSVLLELIYAVGAQAKLLPPKEQMPYILKFSAGDKILYVPVTMDEIDAFESIKDMVEGAQPDVDRAVPVLIDEDKAHGINMLYAAMSLELLFDFVLAIKDVGDITKLTQGQKNSLDVIFENVSVEILNQALLWAMRLGLKSSVLQKLVSVYADKLCIFVVDQKTVDNVTNFENSELNQFVLKALYKNIKKLQERINSQLMGLKNLVGTEGYGEDAKISESKAQGAYTRWRTQYFDSKLDVLVRTENNVYAPSATLTLYLELHNKLEWVIETYNDVEKNMRKKPQPSADSSSRSSAILPSYNYVSDDETSDDEENVTFSGQGVTIAPQPIQQQPSITSRWYNNARNVYASVVNNIKKNIKWVAAGLGATAIGAWLYSKYNPGSSVTTVPVQHSSAVSRSLFKQTQ